MFVLSVMTVYDFNAPLSHLHLSIFAGCVYLDIRTLDHGASTWLLVYYFLIIMSCIKTVSLNITSIKQVVKYQKLICFLEKESYQIDFILNYAKAG